MKAGRNDPCPCGSGKKYKKCCWRKDTEPTGLTPPPPAPHAAERQTAKPFPPLQSAALPSPPPSPPDPRAQAADALWKHFEAQDYEGRIAVFLKTLDDPDLLDDETAFEMLNAISGEIKEPRERERWAGLVQTLRERHPQVFEASAAYYLSSLIADALALGKVAALPALTRELAGHAEKSLDTLIRAIEQLEYHGHLDLLREMARSAWPQVKDSSEILPWAISEFAQRGGDYEIFAYLEMTPAPDAADPVLREALEFYHETIMPEKLAEHLFYLTGKSTRSWTVEDFKMQAPRRRSRDDWDEEEDKPAPPDPGRLNLYHLSLEFWHDLRRRQRVPATLAKMERANLVRYLVERHDGELKPRESMLEAMQHPRQHRPLPKDRPPLHALCPDRATLDRFLAHFLDFLKGQYWQCAATMAAVPAWLRFLETRQLLAPDLRARVVKELQPLKDQLIGLLAQFKDDPTLVEGVKQAWEGVE